jgi:HlyD family secretion protein
VLKRRILTWFLVLAAIAAVLTWALREPAAEVETAIVAAGPLEVTLDQEGLTHIEDRYIISAPVAGYARRIEVLPGQPIEAGEALARLEPLATESLDPRTAAEARAELARAEAAASSAAAESQAATAAAARARQRHERLERAALGGAVTRDELDAATADLRTAEASARASAFRAELARAGVEAARVRLAISGGTRAADPLVTVRAPVAACVLAVNHESEGVVQAGEPLLELGCRQSLEIHADVLSADSALLSPGQTARIEQWGGDRPLAATVRRVEPKAFTKISALGVEEQRVWVVLDLVDPPEAWGSLGDGFRVMVRFLLWHGGDVLQVPAAAVFDVDGKPQVFLLQDDGRLALRPVETGHRSPGAVEILAGLAAGDEVVSHPRRELAAGARAVRLRPGRSP